MAEIAGMLIADGLLMVIAFRDLAHLAQRMAETLKPQFESVPPIAKQRIVSLLCPTNIDFLVAWIACMGLEIGVVFIA